VQCPVRTRVHNAPVLRAASLSKLVPIAANLSVSADFPVDAVNHDEDVEDELADAA